MDAKMIAKAMNVLTNHISEKTSVIRESFVGLINEGMERDERILKLEADIEAINRWIERTENGCKRTDDTSNT